MDATTNQHSKLAQSTTIIGQNAANLGLQKMFKLAAADCRRAGTVKEMQFWVSNFSNKKRPNRKSQENSRRSDKFDDLETPKQRQWEMKITSMWVGRKRHPSSSIIPTSQRQIWPWVSFFRNVTLGPKKLSLVTNKNYKNF